MRNLKQAGYATLTRYLVATSDGDHSVVADRYLAVRPSLLGPWRLLDRVAYVQSLPLDPLAGDSTELPAVDIVIPCGPADAELLPLVIAGAAEGISNPIARISVIGGTRVREVIAGLKSRSQVDFINETNVLEPATAKAVTGYPDSGRRAWVLQQALKWTASLRSPAPGVVVLDADTVLIRSRTWLNNEQQVVLPVHEMHKPYERHFEAVFGARTSGRAEVSHVAHHALFQPSIVRQIFLEVAESVDEGIAKWIRGVVPSDGASPLSEYHTYAAWLEDRRPGVAVRARWANVPCPRADIAAVVRGLEGADAISALRDRYPGAASVSSHSYLR